jgi:hypothetical protein
MQALMLTDKAHQCYFKIASKRQTRQLKCKKY